MWKDSIRDNLSKEDIVIAIQMELSAVAGKSACVVLVEGADDVVFVQRTFEESVVCYESFSGKAGLEELIQDSRLKNAAIIVIRDKDYMDTDKLPERMFVYDYCCMEMMLLACEEVASSFYDIYYGGSQKKENYIMHTMRQLAPYSILRQRNETNKMQINFQKAGIADLVGVSGELDIKELFARIKQEGELEHSVTLAKAVNPRELWNITNGHDICRVLGNFQKSGKKKPGEDGMRQILLSSYRKSDFKKSKLYRDIRMYQNIFQLKYVDE